MHEILNDPVDVDVTFHGKRVHPTHVVWSGRTYAMDHVNLVHCVREGTKRIFYFSISDKTTFMKLKLDTELLEWRLVEMYTE